MHSPTTLTIDEDIRTDHESNQCRRESGPANQSTWKEKGHLAVLSSLVDRRVRQPQPCTPVPNISVGSLFSRVVSAD